jgi:hypothetical protein
MLSADQVPINRPHSTILRVSWVFLIAGSTGSALRAARPPNRHNRLMGMSLLHTGELAEARTHFIRDESVPSAP